jgi:hypothetical protein
MFITSCQGDYLILEEGEGIAKNSAPAIEGTDDCCIL